MASLDRTKTETFLLPGQQFCIGLPWEREGLPKHGIPAPPAAPPPSRNTLDDRAGEVDPCAGWQIGACRVIRRLSADSARSLLALRSDLDGDALVVMRRIELPDVLAREVQAHAQWASQVRHPHLARVYGCEVSDEGIFWVTELASGASLAEIFAACRGSGRAVPLGLALSAAYEAALGLASLTPGSAHSLISNQGVTVAFDGTTKLLDVGLFRCIAHKTSWAEVLEAMGPYLAPEQVLAGHLPDPKCDVFSLGTVLYECLSGQLVRRATFEDRVKQHQHANYVPPSNFNVALGKQLDEVIFRALTPDRAQRYATPAELAQALKQSASAFMWRKELRAKFVSELFAPRKREEEALLASCKRVVRRTKAPSLPPIARCAPPPAALLPVAVQPAETSVQPERSRGRRKIRPAPRSFRGAVFAAALAITFGAWLGASGLVPISEPQRVAPPTRAIVAKLAPPVMPHLVMSLERRAAASTEFASRNPVSRQEEEAPVAVAATPTPRKRPAKSARAVATAREEAPLPPWLMPARKRGH